MTKTYSNAQVQAQLAAHLPRWKLDDNHLTRIFRTGNWQTTILTANAIAFLAEAAWHHPELLLSYPSVTVRLQTHEAGGITDKDFALAQRIEATITWLPGSADALDGKPGKWID
jgi:pterin-4a-carbinolamine dehydratase